MSYILTLIMYMSGSIPVDTTIFLRVRVRVRVRVRIRVRVRVRHNSVLY
jgi:hypothetical protein